MGTLGRSIFVRCYDEAISLLRQCWDVVLQARVFLLSVREGCEEEGIGGLERGKTRSLLAIICSNNPRCVYCPFNRVYITTHSDNQDTGMPNKLQRYHRWEIYFPAKKVHIYENGFRMSLSPGFFSLAFIPQRVSSETFASAQLGAKMMPGMTHPRGPGGCSFLKEKMIRPYWILLSLWHKDRLLLSQPKASFC